MNFDPKFVPDSQHVAVCKELCLRPFPMILPYPGSSLVNVSWIYGYDPETQQQPSYWKKEPKLTKFEKGTTSEEKIKNMLLLFFNSIGIVPKEFVPQNHTVSATSYCGILQEQEKLKMIARTLGVRELAVAS